MLQFLLKKLRCLVCYWMFVTDKWVVPEYILDSLYDETVPYEQTKQLLDKQAEVWGVEDPQIEQHLHFLELFKGKNS